MASSAVSFVDLEDAVTSVAIPRFLNGRQGADADGAPSEADLFFFPLVFLSNRSLLSCILCSPSRMGLKQSKSSLSTSIDSPALSSPAVVAGGDFTDDFALGAFFLESPDTLSQDSSSRSLVRIDEVTSHQIVVRSFLMRQMLQVGAIGLRRP